jgi:acyl carrier protein
MVKCAKVNMKSVDDCVGEIYQGFSRELPEIDEGLRKKVAEIVGMQIYNRCEDDCNLSLFLDDERKWATSFETYGFDSMDHIELFSNLEKGLCQTLPEYLFPKINTPSGCLSAINDYLANRKPN